MQALGADSILVVSNTDDDADGSRDLSTTQVVALSDAAAERGLTVMFEALAWGTHISSVVDAWDVVREADHPNLALVVDTFHLLAGGESVDALDGLPHGSVGFFQLADAPWLSMDLKQWSRGYRCFPGEGEMDLLAPVEAVLTSGYEGPLSLEIFNPGYRERSAHEVARCGAEALDLLAATLAGRRQTVATDVTERRLSPDAIGSRS
jgi:4-hydroxyphenylpyruvate dioxygenase